VAKINEEISLPGHPACQHSASLGYDESRKTVFRVKNGR
jgi:hypothetical protein